MFTRKKSFIKRKGFYIVLAVVLGFGYLVTDWGESVLEDEDISTNVQTPIEDNSSNNENKIGDNDTKQNLDTNINNFEQKDSNNEYYLVKEADGLIKVFYYDIDGQESLMRTTDILFSLLSEEDQKMFMQGVIVNDEEELLELLQDFES
jgi:hypothetical protein